MTALKHRPLQWLTTAYLVLLLLGSTIQDAWPQAAIPDSLPRNVLPGVPDKSLQRPMVPETPAEPSKPPQVEVRPPLESGGEVTFPSFRLEEIQLQNVTLLTREELAPIIAPLLGTNVTEVELLQVTRQVTGLYKAKGYETSRAFLPSQRIKNGIVVISGIENRFGELTVVGTKHVTPEWVKEQISLKPGDFYNVKQLEKDLNRIKQNPRIKWIRANIEPGATPGVNDTTLEVVDDRPAHLAVTMDNTGRDTVGILRYNTTYVHNDFLGLGHQMALSYTGASGFHSGMMQYNVPLNDWGWQVGSRVSLGKTLIGGPFDFLDLTGRSDIFSLYTSVPIIKLPRGALVGELGANAGFANTYIGDQRLDLLEQNVRTLHGGFTLSSQDHLGRWLVNGRLTLGDEEQARGGFTVLSGGLRRWFLLPKGMVLVWKTMGQYSAQNLPGLEQMQIGGFDTIRGYPEGFLIADSGILYGAELHLPMWYMPKAIRDNLEWLLFWEGGNVYLSEKEDPTVRGDPGNAMSLGLGLRGRINKYLTGRLDVGFAQRMDDHQPDARVHFGITGTPF